MRRCNCIEIEGRDIFEETSPVEDAEDIIRREFSEVLCLKPTQQRSAKQGLQDYSP